MRATKFEEVFPKHVDWTKVNGLAALGGGRSSRSAKEKGLGTCGLSSEPAQRNLLTRVAELNTNAVTLELRKNLVWWILEPNSKTTGLNNQGL